MAGFAAKRNRISLQRNMFPHVRSSLDVLLGGAAATPTQDLVLISPT